MVVILKAVKIHRNYFDVKIYVKFNQAGGFRYEVHSFK